MFAVLDSVKTSEQRRRGSKVEQFDKLARQVADGDSLDPDSVMDQLDAIDRTVDELHEAAEKIVQRRQWAAQLGKEPDLLAEHNKLTAEQTTADAEREAAIKAANEKHAAKVAGIQQRLAAVDHERGKSASARNKLQETSPVYPQLRKLWQEHGDLQRRLEGELPHQLRNSNPAQAVNVRSEIAATEREAARLAAEIERLEAESLKP